MTRVRNSDEGVTLVTGATGFVGRHCVEALLKAKTRLRILCRDPEKARRLFGDTAEIVQGDLLQPSSLRPACRGVRSVLNLAGVYKFGPAHRDVMWRVNVVGTDHLFEACWNERVERVVHCSTAGILSAPGRDINATDFPSRPPARCFYKQSKWHGESRALSWADRGLPLVIASPTAPIGAGDERPTPTGRMFLDLLSGRFPAYTNTGLNVLAAQDLAAAIIAVERKGTQGQRYILGGQNIWLGDLITMAARIGGCRAPRIRLPWGVIALAGVVSEAWGVVSGAQKLRLCWETAYFARQRQFFDLLPTFDALDWRPEIKTEQAVTEAIHWFQGFLAKSSTGQGDSRHQSSSA